MKDERITIDRAELEQLKRLATTDRRVAVYSADVDQLTRLILIFVAAPMLLAFLWYGFQNAMDIREQRSQEQKQLVHQK